MRPTADRPASRVARLGVAFAAGGIAILSFGLPACGDREDETPDTVRPLNEIPIEQLRVMLRGYPGDWRGDSDRSRGIAEPPAAKSVAPGAKRVDLVPAAELSLGEMPVKQAIASRASRRTFSADAVSLEELSYLLWSTQGVTREQRDEAGEVVRRFRAAPSGGARYPLETYLAVHRVEGIAPGIYRYLPGDHQLVLIKEDPRIASRLRAACYGQPVAGEAAVVFIWAAVPYRSEWKYTYLAHRMIAMEAGHVCQNLYLAAESIKAGACALLAYDQASLDALIGVDGGDEFTLYLGCVGKVKENPD